MFKRYTKRKIPSRTGGLTGWYGNIEGGLNHPTRLKMEAITKHTGLKYEDVVPKFYNQRIIIVFGIMTC